MKFKSIKTQISFIFIFIIIIVFASNFLINNSLLEKYYIKEKKEQIIDIYNHLNRSLNDERKFDLYRKCVSGNIHIITVDKNLNEDIYISNTVICRSDDNILKNKISEYIEKNKYISENKFFTSYDENIKLHYVELYGILNNGNYFLIRTPIDSINESVYIINKFGVYSFLSCCLIALIFIIILSDYITKPINRLCEISKKMNDLDFSEKYEKGSSKEIDKLGENFNNLSSSLENTLNELKEANIQLEKDIKEKIEIDDMRKDFISNVSHELKTPIALIQGYSEGLKDCEDEEKEFYCDVIIDEAKKMNNLVSQLINLNQIEFGGDKLILEEFDIVELTKGVIQGLDLILKEKNIKIKLNSKDMIMVTADEFRTVQIITNYINNALNHVDENKEIIVEIKEINEKIRLSVYNSGKNIPEEDIDKIWIKFYKTDKARTREYGGSGIGLSIVAAIMNLYEEEYGVINKENGVEFWINLKGKSF